MWSCTCPACNMAACKLMEEKAIIGLPSHYSICPTQLMYQMKKFWLKASILYKQLLSPIHNTLPHMQQYVYVLCILSNPFSIFQKFTSSNLINFSLKNDFYRHVSGLEKLCARSCLCTYRARKSSLMYMKKRVRKLFLS